MLIYEAVMKQSSVLCWIIKTTETLKFVRANFSLYKYGYPVDRRYVVNEFDNTSKVFKNFKKLLSEWFETCLLTNPFQCNIDQYSRNGFSWFRFFIIYFSSCWLTISAFKASSNCSGVSTCSSFWDVILVVQKWSAVAKKSFSFSRTSYWNKYSMIVEFVTRNIVAEIIS